MSGKFNSLKDEVVYRASGDQSYLSDEIGTVDDIGWHGLVLDFYGKDYIITEDSQRFVTVDSFSAMANSEGQMFRSAESGNAWCEIYDAWCEWNADDEDVWDD